MTLPVSGSISLNQVNVELGFAGTTLISMNQASVRTLFGVPTGPISMSNGYGKSNRATIYLNIPNNSVDYNIYANRGGTYITGKTDFIVTIGAGFKVGASSSSSYAISTTGCSAGDTLIIYNNGYIAGKGGNGAAVVAGPPVAGGPAILLTIPTNITNAIGYIYSGGGGGGGSGWYNPGNTYVSASWGGPGGGGGGGWYTGIGGLGTLGGAPYAPYNAANGGLTHGGRGGNSGALGGALNVAGANAPSQHVGGGGGGGGANGGSGNYSGAPALGAGHGVAIQGIGYVTWASGNTRVYGGVA